MNVILFDSNNIRLNLLPFTFTRPVAEIRVGILKISEKWAQHLQVQISFLTENYLSKKYKLAKGSKNLYINGAVCPNEALMKAIKTLNTDEILKYGDETIAYYDDYLTQDAKCKVIQFESEITIILHKHDIFIHNGQEIRNDFKLITSQRKSQPLNDRYTSVYGEEHIFIEEGAKIKACVLNAENGPIYIGRNAEVKEGSLVRGPFALLDHAILNLGAKIQGDTTIGPYSKVGGEVSNSVIFGYSNKGHDGFIGNTVIGEWCNLGADTNTSNLKNNYSNIKVWNYASKSYEDTKKQFHGLMMGDYSKAGINTMFNTGTVVGVSANVFGGGFLPKFVPSFAWGNDEDFETFRLVQAAEVAERVYERRGLKFDQTDLEILQHIFNEDAPKNYIKTPIQ